MAESFVLAFPLTSATLVVSAAAEVVVLAAAAAPLEDEAHAASAAALDEEAQAASAEDLEEEAQAASAEDLEAAVRHDERSVQLLRDGEGTEHSEERFCTRVRAHQPWQRNRQSKWQERRWWFERRRHERERWSRCTPPHRHRSPRRRPQQPKRRERRWWSRELAK